MSKEQTPIEWLKQKLWQRGAIEKKDFELFNEAMKKQEEQTKTKVLEALKSLSDELWKSDLGTYEVRKVFDIIETEVKQSMKAVIKKKVNVIDEITKSAEKAAMKIENQNKLWDRLCEEFAHLDDDNRKARELFDFIIRLK